MGLDDCVSQCEFVWTHSGACAFKLLGRREEPLPDDDGHDPEHGFVQALAEVDQGTAIGPHPPQHDACGHRKDGWDSSCCCWEKLSLFSG